MAQQIDWWKREPNRIFLRNLKKQECIPFIGPEACKQWIPFGSDIASRWAKEYAYPLQDSYQLSRVAQFLAIEQQDNMFPKNVLSDELKKIKPPAFNLDEFRNTPPAVLADLNLPVYITTNYDHIIEAALESRGKQPISDFCRWNEDLADYGRVNEINSVIYKEGTDFKPTSSNPLVYHLHGDIDHPNSMVLTEKDYTDFVIFLNKEAEKNVLPSSIRKPLTRKKLLFVGYSLDEAGFSLAFSVIFQTVISSTSDTKKGISVQVMLRTDNNTSVNVDKVQSYLEQYTNKVLSLDVYWGDSSTFSKELRQQVEILERET
jgi:SIR2-like domain